MRVLTIHVYNNRNDIELKDRKKRVREESNRRRNKDGKKTSSHRRIIKGKNKISNFFSEVIIKWQFGYKVYPEPYFMCTSSEINKIY